jgi:hypothetical protein
MKTIVAFPASALAFAILLPSDADAQHRPPSVSMGVRAGNYQGVRARGVVVAGSRYQLANYRRGYNPGLSGAPGPLAIRAATAAAPFYGAYRYQASDACLRPQQSWNGFSYQWQWVRVC